MGAGGSVSATSPLPVQRKPSSSPYDNIRVALLVSPGKFQSKVQMKRDPLLAPAAIARAKMLGKQLTHHPTVQCSNPKVFCSPLRRCMQTAHYVFGNTVVTTHTKIKLTPRLAEVRRSLIDAGHTFEEIQKDELLRECLADFDFSSCKPGERWWPSNNTAYYRETPEAIRTRVQHFEMFMRKELTDAAPTNGRGAVFVGHSRFWVAVLEYLGLAGPKSTRQKLTRATSMAGVGVIELQYDLLSHQYSRHHVTVLPPGVSVGATEADCIDGDISTDPDDSTDEEDETNHSESLIARRSSVLSFSGVTSSSTARKAVFLVRHGESVNNALGFWQSWRWVRDPPLTKQGREQAMALYTTLRDHNFLQEQNIGAVYCSPLRRAIQTACLVFGGDTGGGDWCPEGSPPQTEPQPQQQQQQQQQPQQQQRSNNRLSNFIKVSPMFSEIRSSVGDIGTSWSDIQKAPFLGQQMQQYHHMLDFRYSSSGNHSNSDNTTDVLEQWWPTADKMKVWETPESVQDRIQRFRVWLVGELEKYNNVVLVGHSHFWKQFEGTVLGVENPQKLLNCEVLQLVYDDLTAKFQKMCMVVLCATPRDQDEDDEPTTSPRIIP